MLLELNVHLIEWAYPFINHKPSHYEVLHLALNGLKGLHRDYFLLRLLLLVDTAKLLELGLQHFGDSDTLLVLRHLIVLQDVEGVRHQPVQPVLGEEHLVSFL